jgi:hypothetical protein
MVAQRQELVTRNTFTFTPTTLEEAQKFATIIANSGLCPESFRGRPNDVLIVLQLGNELGLKPMQALRTLGCINGMPFAYGDGLLALIKRHHEFENIKEWFEGNFENGTLTAFCNMKRKGKEPVTQQFSIEDATRAGLWGKKGTWTLYPKRMLQHRARTLAGKDQFPDALYGLMTEDEARGVVESKTTMDVKQIKNKGMQGLEEALGVVEVEVITVNDQVIEAQEVSVKDEFLTMIAEKNIPATTLKKWCKKCDVENIEDLNDEAMKKIMDFIKSKEKN